MLEPINEIINFMAFFLYCLSRMFAKAKKIYLYSKKRNFELEVILKDSERLFFYSIQTNLNVSSSPHVEIVPL